MPHLVLRTMVRADVEQVLAASLDVDVLRAAGARAGWHLVGGRTGGRLGPGDEVRWQTRLLGVLPLGHVTRIVLLEAPGRFVEEGRGGAFAELHHEHRFEVEGRNMTIVTDRVRWRSAAGPLGAAADALHGRRALHRLLAERSAEVARRVQRAP